MLLNHLHQFLTALIQRPDTGNIAILPNGNKTILGIVTGLCSVTLGHCDFGRADNAFGIHRPHATFCPALQNVFARKVDFIGCRRRFNQLAFRLYCTSFTHLLQFHICRIKTFLLSGCITGLARLAPAKACHADAGAVRPAAGGADKVRQLLTGLPELYRAGGGIGPGGILCQIPALVLAHGALPGPLHLADLVPGVLAAVVLDVPGVQGF